MTDSPLRVRFAVVPAAVLLASGVALVVSGWFTASRTAYLWGLALATVGAGLVVFVALPAVRGLVRAGVCVLLAVAVVGLGTWLPQQALADEFAGSNVRWSIPTKDEFAVAVVGGNVVLADETSARLVRLTDGAVLGPIRADRGDTFSMAGDRLLVVRTGSAMLYDRAAQPVWPAPVPADRGVAAAGGITVVEADATASGIADDGSVRWTRPVDEIRAAHQRFPNVTELPFDNIYVESGPPVLPRVAALPAPAGDWEFVAPATGVTRQRADGEYAGAIGDRPVTTTPAGDECAVWLAGTTHTAPCTFGKPWAYESALFFENGPDATVLRGDGDPTRLKDVSLTAQRHLTASPDGMALRKGRLVRGYPTLRYVNDWQFVAESESATVYAGGGAVVVLAALRRTNPFDPRPGFTPAAEPQDQDYRLTVLDQRTGAVAGEVRAHVVSSIDPVGPGTALIVADGKAMLINGPGWP